MKKFITKIKHFFSQNSVDVARLERQSAQAQKMQAVGQLAGGVAHDFNNILTAILAANDSAPPTKESSEIKKNAERGANLVRQLLAFSRRQVLQPVPLDLAQRTEGVLDLIDRLLSASIEVDFNPEKNLWQVLADPTQLEQIMLNLAVNARDAMPDGGNLTITLSNISANKLEEQDHILIPKGRDYVLLSVRDLGCGISKADLGNIFEPFYSTKSQGSGLGLSTVYGIVKQSDGFIFAESELGRGTTFNIYLPRYSSVKPLPKEVQKVQPTKNSQKIKSNPNGLTVLLVEDETTIREYAARALRARSRSVNVITASSAEEALALNLPHIDVLVSDVVMSGMDGVQLAEALFANHDQLRVILISGYAEDAFRDPTEKLAERTRFLPKPFGLQELVLAVFAQHSR